jgi:hypothetical protein
VDPKLSKLQMRFLKLIDLVARGTITSIEVDAYDDGTRVARVYWLKGDNVSQSKALRQKAVDITFEEVTDERAEAEIGCGSRARSLPAKTEKGGRD